MAASALWHSILSDGWLTITLEQGGTFTEDQVREAEKDPLLMAKLAVRRWDDMAKVPNQETLPLNYYEKMATKSLVGKIYSSLVA